MGGDRTSPGAFVMSNLQISPNCIRMRMYKVCRHVMRKEMCRRSLIRCIRSAVFPLCYSDPAAPSHSADTR